MDRQKKEKKCVICILLFLFMLTFITNRISSLNVYSATGSPFVGNAAICFIGGVVSIYVFYVARKSFISTGGFRILILSLSFLLFGIFLFAIGAATLAFNFIGLNIYLQLFDIAALSAGLMLILSYFAGSKKAAKRTIEKHTALIFTISIVSILLVIAGYYTAYQQELHKYMLLSGSLLFLATGLFYTYIYKKNGNPVVLYYILGFFLIGNGVFNFAVIDRFGDMASWWGMLNMFFGYLMFLAPLKMPEKYQGKSLRLPHA